MSESLPEELSDWGIRWVNEQTGLDGKGAPQYTREQAEYQCRQMQESSEDGTRYSLYRAKAVRLRGRK